MKKLYGGLVLLVLLLSLPVLSLAMGDGVVVNNPNPKDRLHMRTEPSTSATSLGKYYNGTPATVLDWNVKDGWVKVGIGYAGDVNGREAYQLEGYMMRQYLTSVFDGAADRVASAMPEYYSSSSSWELYQKPDKNASSATYGFGEQIRLMGFTDTWWHIAVMRNGDIYKSGFIPANSRMASSTAVVNNPNPKDRLHLRTSAGANAASLGKYYNGVKVQVLSFHMDGAWARVRIGKTEGYMMTEFLALGEDANKVKTAIPTVRLTTDKVNLRETAGYSGRILGQYALGTGVKVWGVGETWLHVEVNGKTGYMLASMLSTLPGESGQATSAPVVGKAATLSANANFRKTASLSGDILAYLGKGTKVTVQSQSGSWYRVRIGVTDAYGWVQKGLVKLD